MCIRDREKEEEEEEEMEKEKEEEEEEEMARRLSHRGSELPCVGAVRGDRGTAAGSYARPPYSGATDATGARDRSAACARRRR
eukprot:6523471-Pyramimonas_sp.AAC.1